MDRSAPFLSARILLAAVLFAPTVATAADAREFHIPAQALGAALNAFASTANVQLSYPASLAEGVKSPGVTGRYSDEEALQRLLQGTGIRFRRTGNGTVTLEKMPVIKPDESRNGASLPKVTVTDSAPASRSLTNLTTTEAKAKLNGIPGGTTLIEGKRIKEGAVATVADAMAYAPGVYVGDSAAGIAGGSRISIRGSDINSYISPIRGVKILRDGLPFTNANGATDTESLNLDTIEYIEVYRGANGLEYGAGNLGGAINLVTPTGYTADRLRVGMTYGTQGYVKPQVSGGGVLGNGWDAYGSFSYLDFNGNRNHNQQELFYGYGNLGYRWNESNETRLHVDVQDHNYDLANPLTKKQLEKNPHQNASSSLAPTGFPVYRVDLRHTLLLDDGDRFDVGAYYFNKDFHFLSNSWGFHRDLWQESGLSWRHQINGHLFGLKNRVVWGGLAQWMWINDRNFKSDGNHRGALTFNERDDWNNAEAYVEDQLSITDTFNLVAGGQVAYRQASYDHRFGALPTGRSNQADQDFFNFNPKLGFTWQALPGMQFYGNLSRSAEPPPLADHKDTFLSPHRTSQSASTVEIGTRGGSERFQWDLAFYHTWLNNELLLIPNPLAPTLPYTVANAGKTQHTGIDLGLESTLPLGLITSDDQLRLRGSYTWSNFHFDDDPTLGDRRLPGVPEHNARFEALYQHPSGFYAGPNVTAVSSNWVDFSNTLAARPYALLGARVGWDDGKHWKVFVDGRNLTNERYAASVWVMGNAQHKDQAQFNPGATRMVFGGFEYRY